MIRRVVTAAAVLAASVVVVPAVAFTLATLGSSTSPEARHLIFALPFYSVLLALPLVAAAGYLAAHATTTRSQHQTFEIARRLHRGEQLYEDEAA